jgi:endoglucanase
MKKMLLLLLPLWCLCPAVMAQSSSKVSRRVNAFHANGPLQVRGTQLCNRQGRSVQLRGMSTHGLQYRGNCYTPVSLELLANTWGADILRISVYVQEGGYASRPAYFTALADSLVEQCYQLGIYALVDWHMLHPGDPNANTALARQFFAHMAAKHAAKGNVLYEICNEPNNDQHKVTWPMLQHYARQVIPVIREKDPASVIIVGTPEFASRPDLVIGQALPYDNLLYTMHFYAADPGQAERMGYVEKAVQQGIPVFVTEFGTQNGWGDGQNDFATSQAWLQLLDRLKISWCNWNYSDSPLSGAAWQTGTCPEGPWTDDRLKEAGRWIKAQLQQAAAARQQ